MPIVNENDISTTAEQLFGDNDQLSSHITHYTNSGLLVLLSDIDGYYDDNPHENPDAKIIKTINEIEKEKLNEEHTPNNEFATGGIVTKLKAAQYLMTKKREMFLCSGYDLTTIKQYLLEGKHEKGTLFKAK